MQKKEDELRAAPDIDELKTAPEPQTPTPSVRSVENEMSRSTVGWMRDHYDLD